MSANQIFATNIPIIEIFADDEFNCRGPFPAHTIMSLSQQIEKDGLLQPPIVQPYDKVPGKKYRMIAGHRRLKAVQRLKWTTIPCIVKEGLTDIDAAGINLKENIDRQDLNILQEAKGIAVYKNVGWRLEDVAKELNQARSWVDTRYKLLELEPEIQTMAAAGLLTQTQIREVHSIPSKTQRYEACRLIKEAKEKGERPLAIIKKKQNPLAKKRREPSEIFRMIEHIMDSIGPGLHTRALAWAAGEISDLDLYRDIREECRAVDKFYTMPKYVEGVTL